eukprot:7516781-Alexandrium_andersonii.AAC.1
MCGFGRDWDATRCAPRRSVRGGGRSSPRQCPGSEGAGATGARMSGGARHPALSGTLGRRQALSITFKRLTVPCSCAPWVRGKARQEASARTKGLRKAEMLLKAPGNA